MGFGHFWLRFFLAVVFLAVGYPADVFPIPLAGSNGRVVEFSGVKSAGPTGLKVQLQSGGPLIDLSWDKIDLDHLKREHPAIYSAYERSKNGGETEINLGSMAPPPESESPPPAPVSAEELAKIAGRYTTNAGGAKFWIQMPKQAEPRVVLLLAMGSDGYSFRYLGHPDTTRWRVIAEKLSLAVMAYSFSSPGQVVEGFKVPPFVQADKGSGEAVLKALTEFGKLTGKPALEKLPIAIYGQDVVGSAFSFNFSQAFPERVIAAVASKGAFYSVKPTEASAKVPLMILWGQYDEDINLWEPVDTHQSIYEAGLPLKANWVYAMEPRAGAGESAQSQAFALGFLDRMILARLTPEGEMKDLDRSRSFVGDIDSAAISRLEDVDSVLEKSQTWLPDGEIGQMWEDFSNGVLKIPSSGGDGSGN